MVELVVTHPLVNILRGAMSILVYVVSHPYTASNRISQPDSFGFRALKPSIANHPEFLQMLMSGLSAADHALCANALQLINSLMREAITDELESDWQRFIKKLQDLGVIKAVYTLMQGTALQDLSHPLLEYQALTKVLLRKWRGISVELDIPDHRRALKTIHLASNPERLSTPVDDGDDGMKKTHNPEKWRRLGFETEHPAWEFEETGYLGMIDLMDYVMKHEDGFQKLLLEQSTKPAEQRCPIARASLAVTAILYEHFEIEKADVDDAKFQLSFESRNNFDKVFKPTILQWSVLHTAGVHAFFRLWQATGAELEDFLKLVDLVRILLEAVVGSATRTKDVHEIEKEIQEYELQRLRQLQMEVLELTYEDTWGHHLRQIRDELNHEALQFVKEQRIRCLLAGAWFPNHKAPNPDTNPITKQDLKLSPTTTHRYAKLSHNRRYLHYSDFPSHLPSDPSLDNLTEKVDLTSVSSVTSNVSAPSDANSSSTTLKTTSHPPSTTKITIHGYLPSTSRPNTPKTHNRTPSKSTFNTHVSNTNRKEVTLLTLHPANHSLASEWLDGLLMLLNQQPITAETNKLIGMVQDYGLKIRLLNVRFDDLAFAGEAPEIPSKEGLDEEYYYDIFGG